IVGKRVPLKDAPEKVTGSALFTGDMTLPGMLYAKVLRSPYAHAKVLRVDTSKAERLPGVKSVLSKNNAPRKLIPVVFDVPPDRVAFDDEVRFIGDEVAAVAAVTEEIAAEALKLIKVDYKELPAVFDPEEAIKPGAPMVHADKPGNIASSIKSSSGDVEAGFREADHVFEETFRTSAQRHACMETHGAIASFDPSGKLTVYTPSQLALVLQPILAEYLDMPMTMVRIIKPYLGGGFGSKLDMVVEHICALLSKIAGKPVKLILSREEEFSVGISRHACIIRLKVGVKKDGTITAIDTRILSNEGAYVYKTGPIGLAAKAIVLAYKCPNSRFEGHRVYTNIMSAGAYRGYGNPQGSFAMESMIDMIAEKLGIDPVEFRLKNYRSVGDIGFSCKPIKVTGMAECLTKGKEKIGWNRRGKPTAAEGKKRGIGVAVICHATGTTGYQADYTTASVRLNEDGTAQVFTGTSDLGTGSNTTLAQIAAEELGLPLDAVQVVAGDTDIAAFDRGAFASKTLYNAGNAVKSAAAKVKQMVMAKAAEKLGVDAAGLDARNGRIFAKQSPDRGATYTEIAKAVSKSLGGNITFMANALFENTGFPEAFGAQFAEVEVDTETGQVEVLKFVAMQDNGIAINPMVVEGQIEGALQHSIGYSLTENPLTHKKTGRMLNPDFRNYLVLTAVDMPKTEVELVQTFEPTGPFGAKGMGELPMVGAAPAIANAIYNATGARITEIPMTPERVFKALRGVEG
ncbi:MAG: molybdopterin-dependent oxidoreductase, partial [Dehalococcoidia bacterium]|nr:molybdopterin-dependent oxidoreductase [Dehalococcoidia bacterium]